MPAFPIIDSHLHVWDPAVVPIPWLATDGLLNRPVSVADFDRASAGTPIEAMVFVECDVAAGQALNEVEWVSRQAAVDPRIQAIVAHAPVEIGAAVIPHLELLAAFPLVRGVRRLIQGEPDPAFCERPGFVEGVRQLAGFGFSFDACILHPQLPSLIRLVDLCPEVSFVLDHIGKPDIRQGRLHPWQGQIRELSRRPNVVCKLSGVATEADHHAWRYEQLEPFMSTVLEAFGAGRTMFGGDWPVATHAVAYGDWVATVDRLLAAAATAECEQIYRGTARTVYRL
jgi:L-fuconolactonase